MDSFLFEKELKNARPPFTIEIQNRPLALAGGFIANKETASARTAL